MNWFPLLVSLIVIYLKANLIAGSLYKQQVIVILDDDATIQRAGKFLYEKHDTLSYVMKWNKTLSKFERVEWNINLKKYQSKQDLLQPIPIGPQHTFSWTDTQIQVVGHGDAESTTIGGFSAEELAKTIIEQLADGDIGYISIICSEGHTYGSDQLFQSPTYLYLFMSTLKQFRKLSTSVSLGSTLMTFDHTGRILTGEIILSKTDEVAIQWKHMNTLNKWVGVFTGERYQIEQVKTVAASFAMKPHYFGILPDRANVYVTDYGQDSKHRPTAYKMKDNVVFEWIIRVAHNTYNLIPHSRATSTTQQVVFFSQYDKIIEISVMEINSVLDLLKELRHYGDAGPADYNTKAYYRFGDWILSMDENNFSVNVEGVIADPNKTDELEAILNQWNTIPNDYLNLQQKTGENFFEDMTCWINGKHDSIGLNMEDAYNAQCGVAMFLSEPIQSFHIHVTNMMSIDLIRHGYLTKEYFFSSHPMGHTGTWQILDPKTGKRKTGLQMLEDGLARSGLYPDPAVQVAFNRTINQVSRISKSWLSHIDNAVIKGSRDPPPAAKIRLYTGKGNQADLLSSVEDIGSMPPITKVYLREYELAESFDHLLSSRISEAEIGAIRTQMEDFSLIDDISLPLKASIALKNDHVYVSGLIAKEVQLKEQQTGKMYEVLADSIEIEEDSNTVRFLLQDASNSSEHLVEFVTKVDKSILESLKLVKNFLKLLSKGKPIVSRIDKVLAIRNVVMGLAGSIQEIENGNLLEGSYDFAQSTYSLGKVTGMNKDIRIAAEKYLGKVLGSSVSEIRHSVSNVEQPNEKIMSTVGKDEEVERKIPIIGTLFSIYNIFEDFNKHTTLGNIDGLLDIAIAALSFLGPEADPIAAALSLFEMGINAFYGELRKERDALPYDPSVQQIVLAVVKGVFKALLDIAKEIANFLSSFSVFATIKKVHELDKQYEKDKEFLSEMSNYKNYFKISRENGSNTSEINFAGGSDSWNGGNIIFHLGEGGLSTLTLETADSSGKLKNTSYSMNTNGVEDIVLGIGESHTIHFKKETVHYLFCIPVHTKKVISGISGEKQTLHGTYYGNSQNNKFIAVQELPPHGLDYCLNAYHYKIYGGGGNDSFYLGPQLTYIEGNEGSDTYFINSTSTFTEINSHAGDGQVDNMIINLNYNSLTAKRARLDLNLTSSNTHAIVIKNWFHDITHQRMVFKTGDGVLFKVSATITEDVELIPYALSGSMATEAQVYDASQPQFSEVVTITGSAYNDQLYGNNLDNHLNGAEGDDILFGGEGKDTYTVDLNKGYDTINNFAVNEEVDTLIINTRLELIIFSSSEESNDLFISCIVVNGEHSNTGVVIKNWFLNETYQHMILVTKDRAIVKVSSVKNATVTYQPLLVNMSLIEVYLIDDSDVYARRIDLSSSASYSDVVTVIGTPDNDFIVGNNKNNYITGAKGYDFMEGKEGADTYVVKEGDGSKVIVNCAKDNESDTLLFGTHFDDIVLKNSSDDLILTDEHLHETQVTLKRWFKEANCQHMLVHSSDGVIFFLPKNVNSLVKTAKAVDNSNMLSNVELSLTGKWDHVERVVGSKGYDVIIGNPLDNYLDPGIGGSFLEGGNGSDTYVIQSTYGENNTIDNYAEDDQPDTVLFFVPFSTIETKVVGMDIQLSSLTGDGFVSVVLKNYNSNENMRHLIVTTSDGITLVLPVTNSSSSSDYQPVPVSINMAQTTTGQHMNLTDHSRFSEVRSVYGSSNYQNNIVGNKQNNAMVGGTKSDVLHGLKGNDTLKGGDGNDIIEGGPGKDILVGENGDDDIDGGDDDDVISPGSGTNRVDGGPGIDTVIYSGDVSTKEGIILRLGNRSCIHQDGAKDVLNNVENAYGTEYDDVLEGDDEDNVLLGLGGSDYLFPGTGYDILNGGNGNDTYDLTNASGTITIVNYAEDGVWDLVVMSYANISELWYEKVMYDLVLRVINSQYPVFYDGSKPTVIFKEWFVDSMFYQHTYIEGKDGSVVDLSSLINSDTPKYTSDSNLAGMYSALGILLLMLCTLIGCVILGVYKTYRSHRPLKGYIRL